MVNTAAAAVDLYVGLFNFAAVAVPLVVGGQVVVLLGQTMTPFWRWKELLGGFVAGLAAAPFGLATYPDSGPVALAGTWWGWTIHYAGWMVVLGWHVYLGVTLYGIARRGWPGEDVWPWVYVDFESIAE